MITTPREVITTNDQPPLPAASQHRMTIVICAEAKVLTGDANPAATGTPELSGLEISPGVVGHNSLVLIHQY